MVLIIGGAGQGKLDYVLEKTGFNESDVARDPSEALNKPVFAGLERWPELDENPILEANPGVIIVCDEIGCGVVPIGAGERERREAVGRLCCRLAKRAGRVERIFCGIPMVLKEDEEWN